MKKQYVSGYGKESKSKERWTFAALAGVCVLVFIITITVAIILMDEPAEEINRAEFVESEEEDIAIVESEEEQTVPVSAINEETPPEPQEWIAPCDGGYRDCLHANGCTSICCPFYDAVCILLYSA